MNIQKKDVENLFEISDVKNNITLLENIYGEYHNIIKEVSTKDIALGGVSIENHKELLETVSLFIELNLMIVCGEENE